MEIGGLGRTALGQVRPHGPLHFLEDFHDDDAHEVSFATVNLKILMLWINEFVDSKKGFSPKINSERQSGWKTMFLQKQA